MSKTAFLLLNVMCLGLSAYGVYNSLKTFSFFWFVFNSFFVLFNIYFLISNIKSSQR